MLDKGHGRIEKRTIETTTALTDYLAMEWPGCQQVFQLTRERKIGSEIETEVVYGMTSLPRDRCSAKRLNEIIRDHWGIENGLHGVRDGTLREDASRIRKGSAPQVMAIFRNIAIHVFKAARWENVAAAAFHFICNPSEALEWVSTPI
jgi:predicted transposase YbfD/YdcC